MQWEKPAVLHATAQDEGKEKGTAGARAQGVIRHQYLQVKQGLSFP